MGRSIQDRLMGFLVAAEECGDTQELSRRFQGLVADMGVGSSNAVALVGADSQFDVSFGEISQKWAMHYMRENFAAYDPVLKNIKLRGTSGFWDEHLRDTRIMRQGERVMSEARDFGFTDGYTRLVRAENGSVFLLCLHGDKLDRSPEARALFRAAGTVFVEEGSKLTTVSRRRSMPASLTPRQAEILRLKSKGLPHKDIATELDIALKTVEVHARDARERIGAKSTSEAIRIATERGWLH